MDIEKIYKVMLEKAVNDEDFRKELLKDAKGALKKIDVEMPDDVKVEVYQSTPDHLHFVLPQA